MRHKTLIAEMPTQPPASVILPIADGIHPEPLIQHRLCPEVPTGGKRMYYSNPGKDNREDRIYREFAFGSLISYNEAAAEKVIASAKWGTSPLRKTYTQMHRLFGIAPAAHTPVDFSTAVGLEPYFEGHRNTWLGAALRTHSAFYDKLVNTVHDYPGLIHPRMYRGRTHLDFQAYMQLKTHIDRYPKSMIYDTEQIDYSNDWLAKSTGLGKLPLISDFAKLTKGMTQKTYQTQMLDSISDIPDSYFLNPNPESLYGRLHQFKHETLPQDVTPPKPYGKRRDKRNIPIKVKPLRATNALTRLLKRST
jgi:hypothetical protein